MTFLEQKTSGHCGACPDKSSYYFYNILCIGLSLTRVQKLNTENAAIRLWLESVVRAISLQFGATYTDFQFVSKCNSSFCCWLYKVWDYHITYSFKNLSDHYNHHWKPCFRDPHCLRLGRWQLQTEPSHQNYETLSPVRPFCLLLFLSSVNGKDIFVWFVFFM